MIWMEFYCISTYLARGKQYGRFPMNRNMAKKWPVTGSCPENHCQSQRFKMLLSESDFD
jgi:hypothetical protein